MAETGVTIDNFLAYTGGCQKHVHKDLEVENIKALPCRLSYISQVSPA